MLVTPTLCAAAPCSSMSPADSWQRKATRSRLEGSRGGVTGNGQSLRHCWPAVSSGGRLKGGPNQNPRTTAWGRVTAPPELERAARRCHKPPGRHVSQQLGGTRPGCWGFHSREQSRKESHSPFVWASQAFFNPSSLSGYWFARSVDSERSSSTKDRQLNGCEKNLAHVHADTRDRSSHIPVILLIRVMRRPRTFSGSWGCRSMPRAKLKARI